jgi:hypothetical protein
MNRISTVIPNERRLRSQSLVENRDHCNPQERHGDSKDTVIYAGYNWHSGAISPAIHPPKRAHLLAITFEWHGCGYSTQEAVKHGTPSMGFALPTPKRSLVASRGVEWTKPGVRKLLRPLEIERLHAALLVQTQCAIQSESDYTLK